MPTVLILVALVGITVLAANIWTEVRWYSHLGFTDVLVREWGTRAILFVIGFLLMAFAVWISLHLAYSKRLVYPPTTQEERNLDRYREAVEPMRKLIMIAAPVALGLFAGGSLSGLWREALLFLNQTPFGEVDPEFGYDIGFFVFTLPVADAAVSFLMMVTFMAVVATLVAHYLYGGISVAQRAQRVSTPARIQLAVLASLFTALLGANYLLDRYSVLLNDTGRFAGAAYSDINAVLPGRLIMAIIAFIVVALFVVAAIRGGWRLPVAGVAVMVVSGLVLGTAYPALIQRFQVDPNAIEYESEFIQRNIDATLAAYGLEGLESSTYSATTEVEAGQLREDSQSTASIRLLDPNIVSPTFNQMQQSRQYYSFADTLAVDRYEIDGESRDTVIAVRELNLQGLGQDQRNWVNDHTVYTHGYGVVAAAGNSIASDGRPTFFQQGIPSVGELGEYEPRVYFGQNLPQYSIVGAPEGTEPWELDFPADEAEDSFVPNTFSGDGGPSVGGTLEQLAYTLRFGDTDILFSDRVTEESQILYDRDPHERVAKAAPYLTLDHRAYPAVVDMDEDPDTDKRLVWIVDAYTTSNSYPYSARESLEDATVDSLIAADGAPTTVGAEPEQVNYIRNSVKAVVDAYDGSVTLFEWDDEDPMLQTWQEIFPDHMTPMSEVSGDLMSHFRYPEDLFKVQRTLLSQYHVTNPATFYQGSDRWSLPSDPVADTATPVQQPPYYLTMQMPGQEDASFSLTSSFIPGGQTERNILTGFLAVDSETGNTPGEVADSYGQLRLLELPSDITVPGPGQVQNMFNANPDISTELNILASGQSEVLLGNLLTLPVGGGLLYVQPVYVQASGGTQYPVLQRVLVSFGEQIGFAASLEEALDSVFDGDSGAATGEELPDAVGDDEEEDDAPPEAQERLDGALADANEAIQDGQSALADSNWDAYGEAQQRLADALAEAIEAQEEISGESILDDDLQEDLTDPATDPEGDGAVDDMGDGTGDVTGDE